MRRNFGKGMAGLVMTGAAGAILAVVVTMGNARGGAEPPGAVWASPAQTALSGLTPIVARVTGPVAPTGGVLVVQQKGIDRPAAFEAESVTAIGAQGGAGGWAVAWRVPGSSYAAGILGARAAVRLADGTELEVGGGQTLALANFSPEAGAGGW